MELADRRLGAGSRVLTSVVSPEGRVGPLHPAQPKHTAAPGQSPPPSSRWGDVFRCPGRKPCVLPAPLSGHWRPAPGTDRGRGQPRRVPGSRRSRVGGGGRADAGLKAWACEVGGARPGMGSGGETEAAEASARARRGGLGGGRGAPTRTAGQPGGEADRLTRCGGRRLPRPPRGVEAASPPPLLLPQPARLTFRTRIPPGRRLAGASRGSGGSSGPAGPGSTSPIGGGGCTGTPGRRDGARSLGGARERLVAPPPAAGRPAPRRPPAAQRDLRSCGPGAAQAPRAASWLGGCADPAGGAGSLRKAGPAPPPAFGLKD